MEMEAALSAASISAASVSVALVLLFAVAFAL
jgi:hypothetical protein